MSAFRRQKDRSRLDGFEIDIFKLVKKEATSEQWKEWLRAPLEHAAAKGDLDLFTRLMDAGADGSAGWRGCGGRTLLGSAAHGRSKKMVLALLKAGGKPDLDVKFGAESESALHVATAQGAEGVCSALMLAGADPNSCDGVDNLRPLHLAAEAGHHVIVEDLLLKGAWPNAKTLDMECTPLHLAAEHGHALCVSSLLLCDADKDSRNCDGETPLFLAAKYNQLCAAEELLAAGANLDMRDASDFSVLKIAAKMGHENLVRAILQHGCDVNACDRRGCTALHSATLNDVQDNGGVVRALLEAGAEIGAKTKTASHGSTPLHAALVGETFSSGTVCALLEGGADVNAFDIFHRTPLHRACIVHNLAGAELLLQWGADETIADKNGFTAAHYVEDRQPHGDEDINERQKADNQRIRQMLARAPADRSWSRRGWLVLCRSYQTKVQLSANSSVGGSPTKAARVDCDSMRGCDETGDQAISMDELVGRVVGLEAEGVFRLVVGFL